LKYDVVKESKFVNDTFPTIVELLEKEISDNTKENDCHQSIKDSCRLNGGTTVILLFC